MLVALLLILTMITGAVGAFVWATGASGPKQPLKELVIPVGATGSDVGEILHRNHVIRSTLAFRLMLKVRHLSASFQAGKYNTLTTNMTVNQAIAALKKGPFLESVSVTFREGLWLSEMAAAAAQKLPFKAKALIKAGESGDFSLPPYLPEDATTVEGFLYPDTYDFFKDATPAQVVQRLLDEFKKRAVGMPWGNVEHLGVTEYQAVIMASIVEGEAKFDEDRAKIARTLYNRLEKGMPLQADVTVLYALGERHSPVTFQDLEVDSPYNTYKHTGLPPTPIDSPRAASIGAALSPAQGDWLYYIADPQGHTHFTSSYSEFLALKRKYYGG